MSRSIPSGFQRPFMILGVALATLSFTATRAAAEETQLLFERDIRPIFRAHCYDCHGASTDVEGGLDLRLVRFIRTGGDSGPAIDGEHPSESLILQRIRSGDMPPSEKKVTPNELATLEKWIEGGSPTARPEPEAIGPGLGITPEERAFWAFQPITPPEVPTAIELAPHWNATSPLDLVYLLDATNVDTVSQLDTASDNLTWPRIAPIATRAELINRVYFDLIGLPPTPDELTHWSSLPDATWYQQLVDQLLESPHYGERWGRHWLDIAGYADSEGYTTADAPRAWAWKYRDWVIDALNQDKPFDRFITEQLAGDELAGPINGDLTPEQIKLLTATGFLRMAADGTGSGANTPEGRNQVMADTLKIVGTSLLGMSLQCAQCHDHRYDPIPQTDYFALRAVFEPALDWQAWQVPDARLVSLHTEADRARAAELEAQVGVIIQEKDVKLNEYMSQALDQELAKFEEPIRTQLREAYKTPANERTDAHKTLLDQNPSVNITPGNLYQYIPESKDKLAEYDTRINEIRAKKPPANFIRALVEPPNHAPETKLFFRGDFQQPKETIAPAALTVATPENAPVFFPINNPELPTTGRRLAFAQWLTGRDNPLFARVIVNRVWLHHFGVGLVNTPGDFGTLGARPTHPKLLDWLANQFMTESWSLKQLHRTIMNSSLYQQSRAFGSPEGQQLVSTAADSDIATSTPLNPFNRLRRLEAEIVRDYMLATTGQLDRTVGGAPLPVKEDDTGQIVVDGTQVRRSLYIQSRRTQPVAMLQSFDAPVMETNCEARVFSTVATQSLMLLNGEFILAQAAKLADRAASEPATLTSDQLAPLPSIPTPSASTWSYGYGAFDSAAGRTATFTPLAHWTGSQWQAGALLPDANVGWSLIHASGGHPDIAERAVIRRWTAPQAGTLTIQGKLSHGSPNGDGVRGRIIQASSGVAGEYTAFNSSVDTGVADIKVAAGETIDLMVDCIGAQTSDSFNWPVTLTFQPTEGPQRVFDSVKDFRGPSDEPATIPGQIVRVWQLAYLRDPDVNELLMATQFVANQIALLEQDSIRVPEGRSVTRQAITNLCHAVLGSNEFLYVE